MAGQARFRVPTLEEMEKADHQEASMSRISVFRRDGTSRSGDAAAGEKNNPAKEKNSPRKHRLSQRALLSHQPLPSRKSTITPQKAGPSTSLSSQKTESSVTIRDAREDLLVRHRVSHVTSDNVDKAKLKRLPGTLTTTCTTSNSITSKWTGNVLGGDSHNAQLPQQPAHVPSTSTAAGVQKELASTTVRSSEQPVTSTVSHSEDTGEQEQSVRADVLPTLAKLGKTNSLVVNARQRGNPILKFVRNVPWEFGNIVPDYVMGQSNCALYLSLRYHQLHPEYIHTRLKQLGHSFDLRVLLVQVDIKDPHHLLKDLAKICILADCTLILAFSAEEAGRYLETYKVYENKAAEAIMERTDSSFNVQLSDCLTRVKSVNRTDCSTLLTTFGSLQDIMEASSEDLSLCPGFGPQKAKRLHDVFREPFLVSKKHKGVPKE